MSIDNLRIVITTKHEKRFVINTIDSIGQPLILAPNFQGILVKGVSLDWPPWYELRDCDPQVKKT